MTFWKTTEYLQLFSRIYTLFIDRLVSRSSDEVKDSIVTKRSPFRINNDLNTDAGIQLINKMPEIPQSHSDSVSRSSFASMEIYIFFLSDIVMVRLVPVVVHRYLRSKFPLFLIFPCNKHLFPYLHTTEFNELSGLTANEF